MCKHIHHQRRCGCLCCVCNLDNRVSRVCVCVCVFVYTLNIYEWYSGKRSRLCIVIVFDASANCSPRPIGNSSLNGGWICTKLCVRTFLCRRDSAKLFEWKLMIATRVRRWRDRSRNFDMCVCVFVANVSYSCKMQCATLSHSCRVECAQTQTVFANVVAVSYAKPAACVSTIFRNRRNLFIHIHLCTHARTHERVRRPW